MARSSLAKLRLGKILEYINDAAAKLSKIVSSLSSITNLRSDKIDIHPEELDLIVLVNQETRGHQIRNSTNSNIKIGLNNKISSCLATVDGFWFKQLLANLIMNAVNHCERGSIEIHTEFVKKDGIDHFLLSVHDEGCGIPENELETIFKPLERGSHSLEKNFPGSGYRSCNCQRSYRSPWREYFSKKWCKSWGSF